MPSFTLTNMAKADMKEIGHYFPLLHTVPARF